jgi:hypothetical protein
MLQPSEEHWCIQELRDLLAGVIDCECDYLWRDPSCVAVQLLLLPLCWRTKRSQSIGRSRIATRISRCALGAIWHGLWGQEQQSRASATPALCGSVTVRRLLTGRLCVFLAMLLAIGTPHVPATCYSFTNVQQLLREGTASCRQATRSRPAVILQVGSKVATPGSVHALSSPQGPHHACHALHLLHVLHLCAGQHGSKRRGAQSIWCVWKPQHRR